MTADEFARQKAIERSKQYREDHPEKAKAYARTYYYKHREEILAKQRAKRLEQKPPKGEKKTADIAAYRKAWHKAHPDYFKNYHAAHREERNAQNREYMRAKRAKLREEAQHDRS